MTGFPRRAVCLTACLAVALLLPGCQRGGNPVLDAAIGHATSGPPGSTGRAGVDGPAASATGHGGESLPLPAHFPLDVYLPGDYRVNSVIDLQDVSVVSVSAPGQVPALFADARSKMQAQGWRQTLATQHSVDTAMLAFEKEADGGGRRSTTLSFNRNNGDDRVIVGVQLRQLAP